MTEIAPILVLDPYQNQLNFAGQIFGREDFLPRKKHSARGHPPGQLDNDITDSPLRVSTKHAIFSLTQGGVCVEDFGSDNGTFINDRRLNTPVVIPWADLAKTTVRFGCPSFVVRFLQVTQIEFETNSGKKLAPRILPPDCNWYRMVFGFCKHHPRVRILVTVPADETAERHDLTICPGGSLGEIVAPADSSSKVS